MTLSCVAAQNGNTALSIACRLGYISVVDTLRPATDETLSAAVRHPPALLHRVRPRISRLQTKGKVRERG